MAGAGYVGLRLMLGLRGWTDGHPAGDDAAGWIRAGSTVLAAAALLVVARGVWTMLRAALDLISRQEVEGQVVRRRSYSRGNDKTAHFIAVDSGRSDRVKAWLVPAGVYARFREGAVGRATVGPRLGHVFEVELVTGPRVAATATGTGETREQPVAAGPEAGVDPVRVVTAEDAGVALGEPVGPARALLQQPLPVGRMRGCQCQAVSGVGRRLGVGVHGRR